MILIQRTNSPEIFESGVARKVQEGIDTWLHAQKSQDASVNPYPTIPPLKRSQNFYSKLLDTVLETFHSKCAFCEVQLKKQTSNLFHYRPFSLNPDVQTNYIWLSWQWPNIYLICETCFHYHSRNEEAGAFPLLSDGQHVEIKEHEFNKLFEVSYLNQIERPLLLDPCWDNSEKFLGYHEDEKGLVVPFSIESNVRASATISVFLLDREQLGVARKKVVETFKVRFEEILSEKSLELPIILLDLCRKDSEFAGMKRYFLQKWMDDHEQETKGSEWQVVWDRLREWREETAVPPQPFPLPEKSTMSTPPIIVPSTPPKPPEKPRIKLSNAVIHQMPNDDIEKCLKLILNRMYSEVDEVIVKTMFDTGFSGALLFHVLPKKERRGQLPRVVKIDKDHNIVVEFENGSKIKDYVSGIIPPISMEESGLGLSGIQYKLSGDGKTNIMSLKQFLIDASLANIQLVFKEELFPTMEQFWSIRQEDHYDWGKYDRILPATVEMEYLPQQKSVDHEIKPDSLLRKLPLIKVGDHIKVSNFQNVQFAFDEIIFNLPDQTCRMKMIIPPNTSVEMNNLHSARPFYGKVLHTRASLLQAKIQEAYLQNRLEAPSANAKSIILPDKSKVSNPLLGIEKLLDTFSNVYISDWIHGDLNLENVLVEYDSNYYPKKIALIDFATIHEDDHILHDFLRLETSVWLYNVANEISEKGLEKKISQLFRATSPNENFIPETFQNLKSLFILRELRKQAEPYLHKQKWSEYFRGLTLYMLGSLKYDNLDKLKTAPSPKMLAFWIACLANHFVENDGFEPSLPSDSPQDDSPRASKTDEPKSSTPEPAIAESDKKFLHDEIDSHFTLGEVKEMCFELGEVDFENLPGETRKLKIIALVSHFRNINAIPRLIAYCKRERPSRDWNSLQY